MVVTGLAEWPLHLPWQSTCSHQALFSRAGSPPSGARGRGWVAGRWLPSCASPAPQTLSCACAPLPPMGRDQIPFSQPLPGAVGAFGAFGAGSAWPVASWGRDLDLGEMIVKEPSSSTLALEQTPHRCSLSLEKAAGQQSARRVTGRDLLSQGKALLETGQCFVQGHAQASGSRPCTPTVPGCL